MWFYAVAFHLAGLRAVWLKVLQPNRAAIAAYEKTGFQHVGGMRRAGQWLGEVVDELVMDALSEDCPIPSFVRVAVQALPNT